MQRNFSVSLGVTQLTAGDRLDGDLVIGLKRCPLDDGEGACQERVMLIKLEATRPRSGHTYVHK